MPQTTSEVSSGRASQSVKHAGSCVLEAAIAVSQVNIQKPI